jgi:hypothetical protein
MKQRLYYAQEKRVAENELVRPFVVVLAGVSF